MSNPPPLAYLTVDDLRDIAAGVRDNTVVRDRGLLTFAAAGPAA